MSACYRVSENLYRGPRPTRLTITAFKNVVNLEEGWDEWFGGIGEERKWCQIADINYYHRPMSVITAISEYHLRCLVGLIWGLSECGPTFVHCKHGEDRTGIVIAAYRILSKQMSVNQAITEMLNKGFHRFPYCYWIPTLRRLAK